jgi:hypothetical protein
LTPAASRFDVDVMRDADRPVPTVPLDVVRDLLAIARAMYRVETDEARRKELEAIGESFRTALKLGVLGAATLGGRAAPRHAAEATARLCALVDESTRLEPALRAVADRLTR